MTQAIHITAAGAGLDVTVPLLADKAPDNAAFLWRYLEVPRVVPGLHAMWTGPEISCPIPPAQLSGVEWAGPLPQENATLFPQPGDLVLAYVPQRVWGGSPNAIFDIGLFYGPGGRMFFPIGWLAGSVVGRVAPPDLPALAEACGRIRRGGACDLTFSRAT